MLGGAKWLPDSGGLVLLLWGAPEGPTLPWKGLVALWVGITLLLRHAVAPWATTTVPWGTGDATIELCIRSLAWKAPPIVGMLALRA